MKHRLAIVLVLWLAMPLASTAHNIAISTSVLVWMSGFSPMQEKLKDPNATPGSVNDLLPFLLTLLIPCLIYRFRLNHEH